MSSWGGRSSAGGQQKRAGEEGWMDGWTEKREGEGENSRVDMKIAIISSWHKPNSLAKF